MPRNSTQHVCLNGLAAAALLCAMAVGCQGAEEQLVLVYDKARLPAGVIAQAEAAASLIFRRAGIELQWLNCVPADDDAPQRANNCGGRVDGRAIVLTLTTGKAFPIGGSMGVAYVGSGGGAYASVFVDRVKRFADRYPDLVNLSALAGHAIAHEIGHLLLSQVEHTFGIMDGIWGREKLALAARGELCFVPQQAAKIREEVRRRAAAAYVR
jgi:hypothetical protein